MKIWYITPSTNIMIDKETDSAKVISDNYTSINSCYIVPEDCKIKFTSSKTDNNGVEYDVKKGQVVLTFYRSEMPNQIVILDSKEFVENIDEYNDARQKEKEAWANKCAGCDECSKPEC